MERDSLIQSQSSSFRCRGKIKLDDPLHCGYMLTFCESEFNKENLSFIIEVDRLRDNMLVEATHAWQEDRWRDIDADFGFRGNFLRDTNITAQKEGGSSDDFQIQRFLNCPQPTEPPTNLLWTKKVIDKKIFETDVKRIWDEFIVLNSPSQICLSATVIERTAFRIKNLHLYGPDVFTEAIEEHMVNTVEADTLPRFTNSEIFVKMTALLCTLYTTNSLVVPSPTNAVLEKSTAESLVNKVFQLFEIVSDGILYRCFLAYLKKFSAERSLLCLQMIALFKDRMSDENSSDEIRNQVEVYSWEIYRSFVTRKAPFEITLCERDRKEIMRNLAKPIICMFDSLRLRSYEILETHFESFSKTDQYLKLNLEMLKALHSTKTPSTQVLSKCNNPPNGIRKVGCFNF
jgi:Regulator of G protein signaling domain